jgi:hypothetical protein
MAATRQAIKAATLKIAIVKNKKAVSDKIKPLSNR